MPMSNAASKKRVGETSIGPRFPMNQNQPFKNTNSINPSILPGLPDILEVLKDQNVIRVRNLEMEDNKQEQRF